MTAATETALSAFNPTGSAFGRRDRARANAHDAHANNPNSGNHDGSDRALMARIAAGDREAIRALLARYQIKVHRFVLRLTDNSATAEDIVSEVFLELWKHAGEFEGRAQLSTWILAIARNKALSALRGRIDQPLDEATAESIPDRSVGVEESLDEARRGAVLRRCLQQLTLAQREIIELVYYHGKSVEEVAEIVGIPPATVKTRMFYARRRLADYLRDAGIETALA